jgi:hypothetical protein
MRRFKYLKRLFGRYTKTGVLRNHLIINNLTVLFNVFGDAAIPLRVIQFINSTLRLYIDQLDGIPFLPGESIDGVDDDNVPLVALVNDAEGSVLKGSKVVTSQYELQPGQKAHYYDVCKMLRLPQFTGRGIDMTGCFWRPHGRKRHGWREGTRAAPPCCYSSTSPSSGSVPPPASFCFGSISHPAPQCERWVAYTAKKSPLVACARGILGLHFLESAAP